MHRLKNYLKSSEVSINKSIVEIQSEIDMLFEEFLNEPSNIKNKVEREIKTNTNTNIIKNCIDAMRDNDVNKGKKIGIAMKIESGLDNVMLNENKDSLYEVMHIEIRDNGKGIPEENINVADVSSKVMEMME